MLEAISFDHFVQRLLKQGHPEQTDQDHIQVASGYFQGDSRASLGNPRQCFFTCTVNKYFLTFRQNLLCPSLFLVEVLSTSKVSWQDNPLPSSVLGMQSTAFLCAQSLLKQRSQWTVITHALLIWIMAVDYHQHQFQLFPASNECFKFMCLPSCHSIFYPGVRGPPYWSPLRSGFTHPQIAFSHTTNGVQPPFSEDRSTSKKLSWEQNLF